MTRHPDWEERLNAYIEKHREGGWPVDELPCGWFAEGAVEAVTGQKPRFPYSNAKEARRHLTKTRGVEGAGDSIAEAYPSPAFAQRGDIILTADDNLAVCFGKFAYAAGSETPDGPPALVRVLMHEWKKAWRVG